MRIYPNVRPDDPPADVASGPPAKKGNAVSERDPDQNLWEAAGCALVLVAIGVLIVLIAVAQYVRSLS